MSGKKGKSGRKLDNKIPKNLRRILRELNSLGDKEMFLTRYDVSDRSLTRFLERRGVKLKYIKIWTLEKIVHESGPSL